MYLFVVMTTDLMLLPLQGVFCMSLLPRVSLRFAQGYELVALSERLRPLLTHILLSFTSYICLIMSVLSTPQRGISTLPRAMSLLLFQSVCFHCLHYYMMSCLRIREACSCDLLIKDYSELSDSSFLISSISGSDLRILSSISAVVL